MILYPATCTHNHSVFDCSGEWSTSDHSNSKRSWTNVARPWFLLKIDPAEENWESVACLQLCSGSLVGWWWKPCSYRLAAQWRRSCLQWAARCSFGVCWVVVHLLCCRALRRAYYDPIPRWTHPSRVAVVALVVTDFVSASKNAARERATWRHLSSSPTVNLTYRFWWRVLNNLHHFPFCGRVVESEVFGWSRSQIFLSDSGSPIGPFFSSQSSAGNSCWNGTFLLKLLMKQISCCAPGFPLNANSYKIVNGQTSFPLC